jgi:hypothetical protein
LTALLTEKGQTGFSVTTISPTIEDCFLELTQPSHSSKP